MLAIKPDFVKTPEGLKRPLVATPDKVTDIVRESESGGDEHPTPFFWRYIMWVIKNISETLFKYLGI